MLASPRPHFAPSLAQALHLITTAAAAVYPDKWAASQTSAAGAASFAANGDCGWGSSNDYKDPSGATCAGQYAYDDPTCDPGCVVVEGIYWASVSYIGGLMTTDRATSIQNEWLMAVPDSAMDVMPSGVANAKTLEQGSPALYALVSDTTSEGHAWLPAVMPDGNYVVGAGATASPGDLDGAGADASPGGEDTTHVAPSTLESGATSTHSAPALWAAAVASALAVRFGR